MTSHTSKNINSPTPFPTAAQINFSPPPPAVDLNILDELCKEVDHLDRSSRTKQIFSAWSDDDPSNQGVLMLILNELHDRLRARIEALLALDKAQKVLGVMMIDISPEAFISHMLDVVIPDKLDMVLEGKVQVARWERQSREIESRIALYEKENADLRRRIARVAAVVGEPRIIDEAIEIDGCKFTLFGRQHGSREENEKKFSYDGPLAMSAEEVKKSLVETTEWFLELNGAYEKTRDMENGEEEEHKQLEMGAGEDRAQGQNLDLELDDRPGA